MVKNKIRGKKMPSMLNYFNYFISRRVSRNNFNSRRACFKINCQGVSNCFVCLSFFGRFFYRNNKIFVVNFFNFFLAGAWFCFHVYTHIFSPFPIKSTSLPCTKIACSSVKIFNFLLTHLKGMCFFIISASSGK